LIIDGTFYNEKELLHRRNIKEIPHPLMEITMQKLKHGTNHFKIFFTHLNHTNPSLNVESEEYQNVIQNHFFIANDFMTIIF